MPASTSPSDEKSILLEILGTARLLKDRLRHSASKDVTAIWLPPSQPKAAPPLNLPYPRLILENVEKFALPLSIKSRIVARIRQWYEDMQQKMQSEYTKTVAQLAAMPIQPSASSSPSDEGLRTFYESFFMEKALKLDADIQTRLQTALTNSQVPAQKLRTPFNNESLPLLETYFEHNAYPSVRDRALLARKSRMCPRQIEVWFQNHRRRAKKEGRRLRRLSQDPLPRELNLEHLNASMPHFLVAEDEAKLTPVKDLSPIPAAVIPHPPAAAATQAVDALCAPAPTYAFPTKYPPTRDHTSCLHSGKTWSFPAPEWPRRASVKAPGRKATVTPNELAVELQQKLSITGSDGVKRTQSQPSAPAWCPFIVVPFAAPHFALIRKPAPPPPAPTAAPQFNPTPREPQRRRTSTVTNYKRPSPYQPRQPLKPKPLGRVASNSSLSSISSSSDESEIRTPSPSPFARYISLPKEASIPPQYPDWDAYLLPP